VKQFNKIAMKKLLF